MNIPEKLNLLHSELRIDAESVAIPTKEYRWLIEAETAVKILIHAWDVAEHTWDVDTAANIVFGALWPKPHKDKEPATPTAPASAPDAGTAIPEPTPISQMGPAEDPFAGKY